MSRRSTANSPPGRCPVPGAAALAFFGVLLLAPSVFARRPVAVLRFGGVHGETARSKIARQLRARYTVLGASAVPDACEDLGIAMSKGRNLARCAAKVNAVAVIGGTTSARKLTLVIFSGKSGNTIATGKVRWGAYPSAAMVRGAMRVVRRGLKKAPVWVGRRHPPPRRPDPPPPVSPTPRRTPAKAPPDEPGDMTFDPDDVNSNKKPPKVASGLPSPPDEDPLAKRSETPAKAQAPDATAKKKPDDARDVGEPKVWGTVGLGTWIRGFSINQPADRRWDKGYSSGAAFALNLELGARPLGFFTDGFAAGVYARLRFRTTLGLKSGFTNAATNTAAKLSTSMTQFLLDFGYHWNIQGKADSPTLDFGLGYGLLNFDIDWGTISALQQVPNVGYRFVLLGVGGTYPIISLFDGKLPIAAMLRFDYRVILEAGGVTAEDEPGYGPSSTGGLALTIGLNARWGSILASFEYTYSRYFYSFSDIQNRVTASRPAAGGALDEMHAIIVSGGYSF